MIGLYLHVALSRQTTKYEEGSLVVHLQPQTTREVYIKLFSPYTGLWTCIEVGEGVHEAY